MPLQIVKQDITLMAVDAIVNTTNETMFGTSGVDGAVHRAAGPEFDAVCRELAPLGLGQAKITPGFNLPAKYVIHTSGPVWQGGLCGESILLRSCYTESLQLAMDNGCETVAFPLISSGTYGYPKDQVLRYAVQIISEYLQDHEMTVYLCVWDKTSYEFSQALYNDIEAYLNDSGAVTEKLEADKKIVASSDAVLPPDFAVFESRQCENYEQSQTMPAMPAAGKRRPGKEKRQKSRETDGFSMWGNCPCMPEPVEWPTDLQTYLLGMDEPFAVKLLGLIDASGMSDVECYKKANVDRKTFSKIRNNLQTYKPSKQTAVAFALALHLSYDQTQELLASAGLTLSPSLTFDKIICYFIQRGIYDVFEINEALFEFDQIPLGA